MHVSFSDDPEFAAAVRAGIMDALKSPEFLRALADEMAPTVVWLTLEQTRAATQLAQSTFERWLAKHRKRGEDGKPGLKISYEFGRKEPRVRFDSLQAVLNGDAVDASDLATENGHALGANGLNGASMINGAHKGGRRS